MDFMEILKHLAVTAGYITTIFTLVSYLGKVVLIQPYEKKRAKEQEKILSERERFHDQIIEEIRVSQEPYNNALSSLEEAIKEFRVEVSSAFKEVSEIREIIEEYDKTIDNHERRIIRLETRIGIKKEDNTWS